MELKKKKNVPCEITFFLFLGILFLLMSIKVDEWLGSEDGELRPKIHLLTIAFFVCILCSAMQDVAVDGWLLTMLQK